MPKLAQLQKVRRNSRLRWKSRVLLVFAPADDSPALLKQRQLLRTSHSNLSERDVIIVEVIRSNANAVNQPGIRLNGQALVKNFLAETDQFKVVLIGKDGGPKLERSTPLEATELFGTIDAMPMRRSEMR